MAAHGAFACDAFAVPTGLFLSVRTPEGEPPAMQMVRVREWSTNLERQAALDEVIVHNIGEGAQVEDRRPRLAASRGGVRHSTVGWALPAGGRPQRRVPPDARFSAGNLKYMRYFAEHCPDGRIGQQPAAQLPWFHVVVLLTQVERPEERAWYADRAVSDGWSRQTLTQHIRNRLHLREGAAVTNFAPASPTSRRRRPRRC